MVSQNGYRHIAWHVSLSGLNVVFHKLETSRKDYRATSGTGEGTQRLG